MSGPTEFIFTVQIPASQAVSWQSLLTAAQVSDLGALVPQDGFIIAPSDDTIVRSDGGSRPTERHTIQAGQVWEVPTVNWLALSRVNTGSGKPATVTLIVYAQ
jgi:hypothetical protein